MTEFSHINKNQQPSIVNVMDKKVSQRRAVAKASIELPEMMMQKLTAENFNTAKGSIIHTAIIAGIMGAKKTGELIPLCHPIGLENCEVEIKFNSNSLDIYATAEVEAKTGVEMEAMTAVSIAALTIYDMCKALSHDIIIKEIKLMEKTGGKNDFKRSE
ncbi:cyclic pyranopterin monophosphate synthase MoaC [Sphingobacterium mizutaii]|uniref:cyclic pyranopterin monophosphate synthase MoaC n=1 Tax=Sphingobacterium mizutaii TaxID=1010 RepID=UPI0028AAC5E4|nr:cyclic pyranopterin monophosphate synthase MoaC [Sphingobacterium mizutaii]